MLTPILRAAMPSVRPRFRKIEQDTRVLFVSNGTVSGLLDLLQYRRIGSITDISIEAGAEAFHIKGTTESGNRTRLSYSDEYEAYKLFTGEFVGLVDYPLISVRLPKSVLPDKAVPLTSAVSIAWSSPPAMKIRTPFDLAPSLSTATLREAKVSNVGVEFEYTGLPSYLLPAEVIWADVADPSVIASLATSETAVTTCMRNDREFRGVVPAHLRESVYLSIRAIREAAVTATQSEDGYVSKVEVAEKVLSALPKMGIIVTALISALVYQIVSIIFDKVFRARRTIK